MNLILSIWKIILIGIGGYFFVLGIVGCIPSRRSSLFYATFICLAVVIFLEVFEKNLLFGQAFKLMVWAFLYVSIQHYKKDARFNTLTFLHLILPTLWFTIGKLTQVTLAFQPFYFIYLVGYQISIASLTSNLLKSVKISGLYQRFFIKWLWIGIILLIFFRLTLPLFLSSISSYMLIFHLFSILYFIGISFFIIRTPFTRSYQEPNQESQRNYEEELMRRLNSIVKHEKAYLIPDLTLHELSLRMNIRSAELSSFFNKTIGKNFNDYLNEYRVEEVKRLIKDSTIDPKSTIMELAYRAGFNSKATFNRIFKLQTGQTPKEFRKSCNN